MCFMLMLFVNKHFLAWTLAGKSKADFKQDKRTDPQWALRGSGSKVTESFYVHTTCVQSEGH